MFPAKILKLRKNNQIIKDSQKERNLNVSIVMQMKLNPNLL